MKKLLLAIRDLETVINQLNAGVSIGGGRIIQDKTPVIGEKLLLVLHEINSRLESIENSLHSHSVNVMSVLDDSVLNTDASIDTSQGDTKT